MADIQDQSHQEQENSECSFKQVKMRVISDGLFAAGVGSQGRSAQVGVDTSENQRWSLRAGTYKNGCDWRFQWF